MQRLLEEIQVLQKVHISIHVSTWPQPCDTYKMNLSGQITVCP